MAEALSVPVGGPSVIFPRGYLWLAPLWYAAFVAFLAVNPWELWFRADCAAAFLIGMIVFLAALNSLSFRAFTADHSEVRLGLPSSTGRRGRRRRTVRHIPWQAIDRVRIARRPYGVRVEFMLSQNASLAVRGYQPSPAAVVIQRILLVIPFWYLTRPTGLVTPIEGPPRYRVGLRGVTVDEIRHSLRVLAPPEVAIAVLVRRRGSVSSATAAPDRARQSA
jgi:hypothetical protein